MNTYLIYKHTNIINNKVYIGQTCQVNNPEVRWRNGNGYFHQPKFYRAIKKYGWKAFTHEVLEYCETQEQANIRECFWIATYNSIDDGYNSSLGGSTPQYFCKAVYQLDNNKNILNIFSSTREAERFTGISQANISKCCLGLVHSAGDYWWCYPKDYETFIVKKKGPSKGQCLVVLQLDLTENIIAEFKSLTEAEKITGIAHQNISKCCKGQLNTAGGYKWRYKNEERTRKN